MQAGAYLLRLDHRKLSYLRLLKLLYLADREWLAHNGESITGDQVFAIKHGPVAAIASGFRAQNFRTCRGVIRPLTCTPQGPKGLV